ncbi:MAG: hypothetical protein ACRC1H_02410 [Caldilineaceae bacterium]
MSTELDLDDVAAPHALAIRQLVELRADRDMLRDALAELVAVVASEMMNAPEWHALEFARHVLATKRA